MCSHFHSFRTIPVMESNARGIWSVGGLQKAMELAGMGDGDEDRHAQSLALKGAVQFVVRGAKKSGKAKKSFLQPLKDSACMWVALLSGHVCMFINEHFLAGLCWREFASQASSQEEGQPRRSRHTAHRARIASKSSPRLPPRSSWRSSYV